MSSSIHIAIDLTLSAFPRISKYPVDFSQPETQVRMLRNSPKYRLFSEALAGIVRGKAVLDIGTGSGILAMICVAHGASRVVALDRASVTEMTRTVLGRYRLGSKVELWEGDLFDLDATSGAFDVMVSETIGYLGFEENIGPILSYAHKHFGDPRTLVMPSDMTVMLQPTNLAIDGHSQSPYLTLHATPAPWFVRDGALQTVKLGVPMSPPLVVAETWRATAAVTLNAVAVYFNASLLGTMRITNKDNPNWPHCVVPLAQLVRLAEGQTVTCRLQLDPVAEEIYQMAISVRDASGKMLGNRSFESTQIRTDLLPAAPSTVDTVVQEVENNLRALRLFDRLV